MFKLITRFFRHIKEGFLGVKRHFGMAFSSASAVTITLVLVALFLVVTANLDNLTRNIEHSISLSALIRYDVTAQSDLTIMQKKIESLPGVGEVIYRNKADEFDYYVAQFSDEEISEFYELYRDDNPFHDVFLVGVDDGSLISSLKASLLLIDGIDSVYDGGSSTYLLVDIISNLRYFGAIIVACLCALAIYLIYNTIKITIASRTDEIWIMRNVGARNSYIRAPFLVEGIIIGLMGSIVPIICVCAGYYYLMDYTGGILLGVVELLPLMPFIAYLSGVLAITGVVVGFLGSYISVCKYLRMKR